jgi:hypothetical protein
MLVEADLIKLSQNQSIIALDALQQKIRDLEVPSSELLDLTREMYTVGSKSHLNSLNPMLREELGIQLTFQTEAFPAKRKAYTEKKNKYLSVGKSFAAVSFLFDLVDELFTDLDILLMHELLMDDGQYRDAPATIMISETEQKVFSAEDLQVRVEALVKWLRQYNYGNSEISRAVMGTLFHYYFMAIHPFSDGNGRTARIFLNLLLLQSGHFPVIIPDTRRLEYYQTLLEADRNNFDPLIDFIAGLVQGKQTEYLRLTEELANMRYNTECLVLTEDGNTTMIKSLLRFSGFDMDKTFVESYDGKDNIAAAAFLARKTKEKKPHLKHFIFHRDRDCYQHQQLVQNLSKLVRNNGLDTVSTIFITEGYDMESYFLDARHINSVFPAINVTRAHELIEQATVDTEPESKRKLRIAWADDQKFNQTPDPAEVAEKINTIYDKSPSFYRYGKGVLWALEKLITAELGEVDKISLVKQSPFIEVRELKKALSNL